MLLPLLIIGYVIAEITHDVVDAMYRPSNETLRQPVWTIFQTVARGVILFAASALLGRSVYLLSF